MLKIKESERWGIEMILIKASISSKLKPEKENSMNRIMLTK